TFREATKTWPADQIDRFIGRLYPDYWLKTEPEKMLADARLVEEADKSGQKFASVFKTDAFTAITELTLYAPNHPRLLALFAGACAATT
ncbi:hypothetical protein ACKI1S_48415, partial [Streptomyces galilaeus]